MLYDQYMKNIEKKPYSSKRWTDIPIPESVGHVDFSEEEKRKNNRKMEEIMRAYGVISFKDHVENGKVVKG